MLLASLLGSVSRSYVAGAAFGWAKIQSQGNLPIGDFNALRELGSSDRKAVVELTNLKALEKQLKEFGPDALRQFKRNARAIGHPARDNLRQTFRSIGIAGPLGFPKREGRRYDRMLTNDYARLSFPRGFVTINSARGIDVNYKNRNEGKALRSLQAARDGTISIVRLIVRSPALIVADMAGKSKSARKNSGLVRPYKTNLFNRGVIEATPRMRAITPDRVNARTTWLDALNNKSHKRRQETASRYAWPSMEKYMDRHKSGVAQLLNDVITATNKKLAE